MLEIKTPILCAILAAPMAIWCGCNGSPVDQPESPGSPMSPEMPGSGGGNTPEPPATPDAGDAGMPEPMPEPMDPGDPDELVEDRTVYEQDDLSVLVIRLTVTDEDGLDDVHDDERGAEVDVLFEADGYDGRTSGTNAELRLRGASAREATQKSYRIKLDKDVGLWRGHRRIHLNKHPWELTRIRQKLSFDFFAEIRHMASLRTSFVRLYINGEDMGFYTQIEHPGEDFLRSHGLDPLGQVYKAESLKFTEIPEDAWEDEEELEDYVEIKANPNNEKFREMLTAINDESRDIDDVIDTYFHRDNYLTWWASNLLMSNWDTTSHNFLLYSPSDSKRWYFLPWDYDDSWGFHEQPNGDPRGRPVAGPQNWWHIYLHRRFLEKPGNVDELLAATQRLQAETLTAQRTAELLGQYHDVLRANIEIEPDILRLPGVRDLPREEKLDVWEQEYARLAGLTPLMLEECFAVVDRPMPFYLKSPDVDDDWVQFEWDASYDMQGDAITYDIQVGTSATFAEDTIVQELTGLTDPWVEMMLPRGDYLWRVIARDDANPEVNWQTARNSYDDDETDTYYRGIKPVEVD